MEGLESNIFKSKKTESILSKRKYSKNKLTDKNNITTNIEQFGNILNNIPDKILTLDKKQKIINNANTIGLNGDNNLDKNILNYNKFHKNIFHKKEKKEPTIKIMSKSGSKKIKQNIKINDDFEIYDYILSYEVKPKNMNNNFDKYKENEIKLLLGKKGIHAYDIQKNQFDNGKYNFIKFKVRENENKKILDGKIKKFTEKKKKKSYKIDVQNYKKGDDLNSKGKILIQSNILSSKEKQLQKIKKNN